jgi:hypothetical protein
MLVVSSAQLDGFTDLQYRCWEKIKERGVPTPPDERGELWEKEKSAARAQRKYLQFGPFSPQQVNAKFTRSVRTDSASLMIDRQRIV